jgi:hypothetical protein
MNHPSSKRGWETISFASFSLFPPLNPNLALRTKRGRSAKAFATMAHPFSFCRLSQSQHGSATVALHHLPRVQSIEEAADFLFPVDVLADPTRTVLYSFLSPFCLPSPCKGQHDAHHERVALDDASKGTRWSGPYADQIFYITLI